MLFRSTSGWLAANANLLSLVVRRIYNRNEEQILVWTPTLWNITTVNGLRAWFVFPHLFYVFTCTIFHLEENVSRKRWFRELALIPYELFDQSFDEICFSWGILKEPFLGGFSKLTFIPNIHNLRLQIHWFPFVTCWQVRFKQCHKSQSVFGFPVAQW